MKDIFENKHALRVQARSIAAGITAKELRRGNLSIRKRVLSLPEWRKAKTVFIYLSMKAEPETFALIRDAWESEKITAVPRCLENGVMEARQISSFDGLTPKSFGILEPDESYPLVLPKDIDLVIAPCTAADKKLHRLGNGKGYYDRYLPGVSSPVICLCRQILLLEDLPATELDIPVTGVVTEEGVYR